MWPIRWLHSAARKKLLDWLKLILLCFQTADTEGDRTVWHQMNVHRPWLQQYVLTNVRKGARLLVHGRLDYSTITREDGTTTKVSHVVVCKLIYVCKSKSPLGTWSQWELSATWNRWTLPGLDVEVLLQLFGPVSSLSSSTFSHPPLESQLDRDPVPNSPLEKLHTWNCPYICPPSHMQDHQSPSSRPGTCHTKNYT